jgi:RNase P/RNase MRP subunit p30
MLIIIHYNLFAIAGTTFKAGIRSVGSTGIALISALRARAKITSHFKAPMHLCLAALRKLEIS